MAQKKKDNGESRSTITSRNKASKQAQHDRREARMVERTQSLLNQRVHYRDKGQRHPLVGTVTDVLRKGDTGYPEPYDPKTNPEGCKRKYGAFVKIRTPEGNKTVSRHRVKLIKKDS